MTTTELITELRARAKVLGAGSESSMMLEAADLIEDMDERLSIVGAVMGDMNDELNRVHRRAGILDGITLLAVIITVIWTLIR